MDRSDVVSLIAETVVYDSYGVPTKTTNSRKVFCQVDSVTRAEFFDGGRNGLNPEFRVRMFYADYGGEILVGYKGILYSVYRVYKGRSDIIELYIERKGGTNGTENTD